MPVRPASFVLRRDGAVRGFLVYTAAPDGAACLETVWVSPAERGLGAASHLITMAVRAASDAGFDRHTALCHFGNALIEKLTGPAITARVDLLHTARRLD